MDKKMKERLNNIALLINGLIFIVNGIEFFGKEKLLFALILFFIGVSNLLIVYFLRKEKSKSMLNYSILILNVIAASTVSVYYFTSGGRYLQYAWIVITFLSANAILIYRRKNP
jgi:hypothetical protein